tara:strand:- start:794 stop:1018 length:225 start_codon:yes stop_codon:yes gene_type:complete
MTLANDIVSKSSKSAKAYQKSHTGRPPKHVDEHGNPESSHSIGERYKCSYGKIMWLFKKYDGDYLKVYETLQSN